MFIAAAFALCCLQVEVLKALCVEFMEQDVTAEKACVLFVEGRKLLNEPAFGLSFIEENFEDITKTDGVSTHQSISHPPSHHPICFSLFCGVMI